MVSEAPAQNCCKAQWLGSNPGFEQAGENLVDADFEVMNDDKKKAEADFRIRTVASGTILRGYCVCAGKTLH